MIHDREEPIEQSRPAVKAAAPPAPHAQLLRLQQSGGVKSFALMQKLTNSAEHYQALLDQIGMIAHAVHEAGGVLEAARRYELFKYVFRVCQVFEQAGIQDERLAFFKNWSELGYRVDRDATGALDRPDGAPKLADSAHKTQVRTDPQTPKVARSDQFLLDNYGRFGEMVEHHGLDLGKKVQGEGGGSGGPAGSPTLPWPRARRPQTASAVPRRRRPRRRSRATARRCCSA